MQYSFGYEGVVKRKGISLCFVLDIFNAVRIHSTATDRVCLDSDYVSMKKCSWLIVRSNE